MSLVTYNSPLNIYVEWFNGKTEVLTGCIEDLVSEVIKRARLDHRARIIQTDNLICNILRPCPMDLAALEEKACKLLFENYLHLYDFYISFNKTIY